MKITPELMEQMSRVQAKYTEQLMRLPNVQGTAIGSRIVNGKATGEIALVVLVTNKVPLDSLEPQDRIPQTLDGCLVDVQDVGRMTAGG